MFIQKQNQNSEVQSQLSETEVQNSLLQLDDYILNEDLEIEQNKQQFSMLFEELVSYSINTQEVPQNYKNRYIKINEFKRRTHRIVKKQQERKRNLQSAKTHMQINQQRDFNKSNLLLRAQCIIEEIQAQQGEWRREHQIQVQGHIPIPLCQLKKDQNLKLLNMNNDNVDINDNCINQELNSNQFQMNANLIQSQYAPKTPNY